MWPVFSFLLRILAFLYLLHWIRQLWFSLTGTGRVRSSSAEGRPMDSPTLTRSGQMQRDPICGTFIAQELAITWKKGDKTVYFCSDPCRALYLGKGNGS